MIEVLMLIFLILQSIRDENTKKLALITIIIVLVLFY